jgi:hypothetical protein
MSKKIELTLTSDYVPHWTITDAVRELFQNAIDNEEAIGYEYAAGTLAITSANTQLTTESLLLGASTKAGQSNTIGQFGEGYKLAALVLNRLGKQITFYTGNEVWTTKFVQSRRFGAKILTFFIDKTNNPTDDLIVKVTGITPDEWQQDITPNILFLRDDTEVIASTKKGDILSGQSRVYINGLYVCDHVNYVYSYDFAPSELKLGRDRRLASDFDLQWLASKLWITAYKADPTDVYLQGLIIDLLVMDAADTKYLTNIYGLTTESLSDRAYSMFKETYGEYAIPVVYNSDMQRVHAPYTPVLIADAYYKVLSRAHGFIAVPDEDDGPTAQQRLAQWLEEYGDQLSDEATEALDAIIEEV